MTAPRGSRLDSKLALETLFDRAAVGLAFLDQELRLVHVNEALGRMTGVPPEAHLGRRPDDVAIRISPDVTPYLESVLDTGRPVIDLDLRAETKANPGSRRKFLVSFYPVGGPEGPSAIYAVITETAERPPSEQALRARERRHAATATLGMRALETDDLGVVMDEAVEVLADALELEYAKVLELLPDGEALLLRAGVGWHDGLVGNARVSSGVESQAGYTLLSGRPVIVQDLAREQRFRGPPLLVEHGVVSGMSVVIHGRDQPYGALGVHTAQRRPFSLDDVNFLQAVANVLAAAIEQKRLREELVEAEALRQSDQLKSALLRAVSHDVRSPLTTIVAAAEALQSRSADSTASEFVALVVSESSRLANLVDKLLDVARLEAGAATPRREWCSLDEILEAALDQLHADGDDFRISVPEDLPLVCVDGAQLERVFGNLFENASRFSDGQPIEVHASAVDGKVLVRVSDRGPGVPEGERERIFQPFFRREAPRTRNGGSGLGLAIAKGFIDANGGRIWVERADGGGAAFAVELPLEAIDS